MEYFHQAITAEVVKMDARLHDSQFMGIRILSTAKNDEGEDIQLSFTSVEGEIFQIILRNTQMLKCDNFRNGNTVFDISELKSNEVSRHALERLACHDDIEYVRGLNEDGLTKETERIREIIRSGMKYIEMGSSYGADLLAICERVEIEPLS